jgi:hypothetical protein
MTRGFFPRGFVKRLVPGFVLCCALISGSSFAQDEGVSYGRGQGWSVLGGDTVGANNSVVVGQLGWPGLTVGVLHGTSPKLDIGGKFSFNYGQEGLVEVVEPGIKLQAWVRLMLARTPKASVAITFQPGPLFYFHDGSTDVGLALPVAVVVGMPLSSAVVASAGVDVPFHVYFGAGGGPVFPLLVGGGLEYFVDRNLSLNFNVRMGPSVFSDSGIRGRGDARFTMEALFGLAWKLS